MSQPPTNPTQHQQNQRRQQYPRQPGNMPPPVANYPQQYQNRGGQQPQIFHHPTPQFLHLQQLQQQQQQLIIANQTIHTLESQLAQVNAALTAKTQECETLLSEIQTLRVTSTSGPSHENAHVEEESVTHLDATIVSLLENLQKEVEEKRETVKALQQQLQASSFTTESIEGKRLASLVSLLEAENKSLLAHLSGDSRIEHLQMLLAQKSAENLALKVKLQETEELAVSLDAELEYMHQSSKR